MKKNLLLLLFLSSFSLLAAIDCNPTDITLATQVDVDNFVATSGGCDAIVGNLFLGTFDVGGSDIDDISGLIDITSIGGELNLRFTNLTSLDGLQNLVSIGSLSIGGNSQLTDLDELESLTSISGALSIVANGLTNINALINITTLGGLSINNNSQLLNLEGLQNLSTINGFTQISGNIQLTDFNGLRSLNIVNGRFQISRHNVTNLDGLQNLTSLTGDLLIIANFNLTDFCGLNPLLSEPNNGGITGSNISGNTANPTIMEIIDGGPCGPPPCSISNPTVVTEDACDGDNATFALTFDVTSGSGDYNIVAAEANADLGVTDGQVLGNITGGSTDGTAVAIMGSVSATTTTTSLLVRVIESGVSSTCTVAEPISVTIASCAPLPCSISNLTVVTEDACDGDNATFALTFDVVSGSGDYNIVAAEANAGLGVTDGQVLGSLNGAMEGMGLTIMGTVSATTTGGTLMVQLVDAGDNTCTAGPVSVTIASCVPPCTIINDIKVLNEAECNENDATFSLSFDVADGSGNYNIVTREANEALGIAANQILGSITNGDTDADDLQIMGSVPNTTEAGSISVAIVDVDNLMCVLSLGVPVTIAVCIPTEPLPAMNRWGLILFFMLILSAGLLAYRRF